MSFRTHNTPLSRLSYLKKTNLTISCSLKVRKDLNFHENTRNQRRGAFCLVRLEWSSSSQIITVHVAFLACKPMARKATIEHLRHLIASTTTKTRRNLRFVRSVRERVFRKKKKKLPCSLYCPLLQSCKYSFSNTGTFENTHTSIASSTSL